MPGARKVFRLEAILEGSVDELYEILFVRVEEMHLWNPSIQHIKVSCLPFNNPYKGAVDKLIIIESTVKLKPIKKIPRVRSFKSLEEMCDKEFCKLNLIFVCLVL